MTNHPRSPRREIAWLKTWLTGERKRAWVPWMKPIIASAEERLAELIAHHPKLTQCTDSAAHGISSKKEATRLASRSSS